MDRSTSESVEDLYNLAILSERASPEPVEGKLWLTQVLTCFDSPSGGWPPAPIIGGNLRRLADDSQLLAP